MNEKNNSNIFLWVGLGAGLVAIALNSNKVSELIKDYTGSSPTDFIKHFLPYARLDETATGVPALVTLAQAGLESGWGTKAYGNNYFGIKANKGYTGLTQSLLTWECGYTGDAAKDGITDEVIQIYSPGSGGAFCGNLYSYRVRSLFRKYNTPLQSFADHSNFLKTNNKYSSAFIYKSNPIKFAEEVAKAGYATASNYGSVLKSTINDIEMIINNLNL